MLWCLRTSTLRLYNARRYLRSWSTRMESSATVHRTDEVIVEKLKSMVIATLNRPKALNALNTSMIDKLTAYFREWDKEGNDVEAIVVRGAGGKAFCAGGDVKDVVLANTTAERIEFFLKEYRMNYLISKLRKPVICLMDGIVMGGGCGIAMHVPFRIATERTLCAMPECVIGFTPDVGSSYFLNRLPESIGTFMAMTGKRIQGLELKAVGLATHYIASQDMNTVLQRLESMGTSVGDHSAVNSELVKLEVGEHFKELQPLQNRLAVMGGVFNPFESSVEQIIKKLENATDDASRDALAMLNGGAPLSVALAHELLKRTAGKSLRACLETEMCIAANLSRGEGDFFEGVRALLIDKDKDPQWRYQRSQVTPELVNKFFEATKEDAVLFGPSAKL